MAASRVSSDATTAFHTALTSSHTSNSNNVGHGGGDSSRTNQGHNPYSWNQNGYGQGSSSASSNNGQLTESAVQAIANTFREHSNVPSASSGSKSSYATSSRNGASNNAPSASYAQMANQRQQSQGPSHYQYYSANNSVAGSRQSSAGWLGSANVGDTRRNPSLHDDSSSSGSSSGRGPYTYRSAAVNGASSQSGRSGSDSDAYRSRDLCGNEGRSALVSSRSSVRSQTSVETPFPPDEGAGNGDPNGNGNGNGNNQGLFPTYQAGDTVRSPEPSVQGWVEAFKASGSNKKRAQDEEELAAGIAALGMTPDLKEKNPPRYIPSTLPPPTSEKAWTFKQQIQIPKGKIVDPITLRGPTEEYHRIAGMGSNPVSLAALHGKKPKLIVLDLNQTLVTRKKSTTQASRNATPRPFLSSFLEYICGSDEIREGVFQRRFAVMVWSSAEGPNVQTMCENIGLFTNAGAQAPLLVDVWDRSSMDLTAAQFNSKFPTIKDLSKLWKSLQWAPPQHANSEEASGSGYAASDDRSDSQSVSGSSVHSGSRHIPSRAQSVASAASGNSSNTSRSRKDLLWSQYDTILIDDSPSKAALQPYNHLSVPSWKHQTKPAQFAEPSTFGFSSSGVAGGSRSYHDQVDTCLLQLIGMLERLRVHTNVSSVIMTQNYNAFGEPERAAAWRDEGIRVLDEKEILRKQDYDPGWAKRVLARVVPPQADGTPARLTSPVPTGPGIGWT